MLNSVNITSMNTQYLEISGILYKHCTRCDSLRDIDYFPKSRKTLYSYCKDCHSKIQRDRYQNNPSLKEKIKKELRNKSKELKTRCVIYLGSKCNDCPNTLIENKNHVIFDFHHLDPSQKDFALSTKAHSKFEDIKSELDKCILLCGNCHAKRHFKIYGEENQSLHKKNPNKPREKTNKLYVKKKHVFIDDIECKQCPKCNETVPITKYYKNKTRWDGLGTYCGKCESEGRRDYLENSPAFKKDTHNKRNLLKRKHKFTAIQYLGGKCSDCPIVAKFDDNDCIFNFHHRDPNQKVFTIGTRRNRTFESLKPELDKCDLLCRNCHALRHYEQEKGCLEN